MTKTVQYLLNASKHANGDGDLWLRYLYKCFVDTVSAYCTADVLGTLVGYRKTITDYNDDYDYDYDYDCYNVDYGLASIIEDLEEWECG
jgi:hypothetical protein